MLKKNIINLILNKCEKYNNFFDYLRVSLPEQNSLEKFYNYKINQLDLDNSNFAVENIDDFDITFIKQPLSTGIGLIGVYSYNGKATPLFIIERFYKHNQKLFGVWGKLDFYGAFHRLKEIGVFKQYFFYDLVKKYQITRNDFKFDIFNYQSEYGDISYLNFMNRKNKKGSLNITQKETQNQKNTNLSKFHNNERHLHLKGEYINSWSLGDKDNKTCVIRGYDKLLDSEKKGKQFLYGDYFSEENKSVFRIEFEFGVKFCKGFTLETLDKLEEKILGSIGFKENTFKGVLYISYEKIDLSNEIQRTRYFKQFNGYLETMIKNGINPYFFVDKSMIKEQFSRNDIKRARHNPKSSLFDLKK